MASYPDIDFELESEAEPLNGHEVDIAEDGTIRSRISFTHQPFDFTVKHRWIPYSDIETLQDFYTDNKYLTIQLTWKDSLVYDCVFTAPPRFNRIRGPHWEATFKLRGILAA